MSLLSGKAVVVTGAWLVDRCVARLDGLVNNAGGDVIVSIGSRSMIGQRRAAA
ncbi:hypothetical protein [Amycolatopsis sp. NPDC057786]|uniref:hypothetical protein n=1 Tax=Amycolatopsis sp. NPDC057786 TaxID=3346250 RepID=UPI00366E39AE